MDGYIGTTVTFEFAKLPKGGSAFVPIHLDKIADWYPGGVAWDGKYVGIVAEGRANKPSIYRVSTSGSSGHVVSIVHLDGLAFTALFAVNGKTVAGSSGGGGASVSEWRYPHGGKATKNLASYAYEPRGMAISVANK